MRTLRFKTQLLSFASAAALAIAATPATAQDTDTEDEVEEIVVTGIRGSIMSSIAKKRANSSIVEAISAEDIGKLPDASIGESLARLPGLVSQRFDGRANKISIRGLAPDFTATTLNGREMVSSDNNRSVEFDQFPSELITGALVYKTPNATLTSQAIGGTVDMQTIRPLSHDGRTIVVGLRGELGTDGGRNPGVSNKGYRGNFAYIDQNEDGSVGWALGYSRMVQPISEQQIHHWGYPNINCETQDSNPWDDNICDTTDGAVLYKDAAGNDVDPTTMIAGGIKPFVKSNRLTRDGLLGVIEFKPSDAVRSRIDTFYSRFKDNQTLRGVELPLLWSSAKPVSGSLTVEDGLVTSGSYTGVRPMLRNDFIDRDVETYAVGWNTEYQASDSLVFTADLSYSKATRSYVASEMYMSNGRGGSGPSYDVDFAMEGDNGMVINSDIDLTESGGWKLGDNLGWGGPLCDPDNGWQCASQDVYRNSETSSDDLAAIKLAAEQSVDDSMITSMEYGIRYSERNKDHDRLRQWAHVNAYNGLQEIPQEFRTADTSLEFFGLGNLISFDPRAVWDSGLYAEAAPDQFQVNNIAAEAWDVKEKVFNAYVMANFETGNLTGNVGLQAVHTNQSSVGAAVSAEGNPPVIEVSPTSGGVKFWEILPSVNMSYNIDDNNKIRFGAARIMARPNMSDMHASRQFSFDISKADQTDIDNSPWGGWGGNPTLKPWMSWQFDLAYETYFGEGGYFAISGFYKKLDSWVYDENNILDFSGFPYPSGVDFEGNPIPTPTFFDGKVWSKQNGEGGKIQGVELSTSIPFGMFSESLDGFGFLGSASFTSSEVREKPEDEPFEMPALSKTVMNGTLYYEKNGFAIRGSVRHRSTYIAESYFNDLSREYKNAHKETIFDAQISYNLDEVGVEGGTLYLQGSNLTNEPYISYENGDERLYRNYHTYGRNFMFGFSYKM